MKRIYKFKFSFSILIYGMYATSQLYAQAPQVDNFSPLRYSTQNTPSVVISAGFDQAMAMSTVKKPNILVYGEQTGFHDGNIAYFPSTRTLTFTPATLCKPGERVTVILTQGLTAEDGTPLASGFQWSFFIQVAPSSAVFERLDKFKVQQNPQGLVLGDFDNDNDLDMAVSHSSSDNIEILFNDGTGLFQSSEVIDVQDQPRSLIAVDFDSDGDMDLVVANEISSTLTILNNDGGKFSLNQHLPITGELISSIFTGDFNGDGTIDVATTNRNSDNVTVVLNMIGSFTETGPFPVGSSPRTGFAADFNNDGILDIVTANKNDATFSLLTGNGDGTFQPQQIFTTGAGPHAITAGDFNGDNIIDVAVTNRDEDTVWPLINTGSGFTSGPIVTVGREPRSLFVRDLDGDLDFDMLVGNFNSANMSYLNNNAFGAFSNDSTYDVGNRPRIIAGGDLDGDGDLDLAVSNWGEDTIEIFMNLNAGGSNRPPQAPVLNSPDNLSFFNSSSPAPILEWQVPTDADSDSLHFRIELGRDVNFNSATVIESINDVTGFSPTPPVPAGQGTVSYSFATNLDDGEYWWRVSAWDGSVYGSQSAPRSFIVDTTPPTGTLANSPAVSAEEDFLVTWRGGTDSGSGLSGTYDVMVQVDNSPWTIWKSNTQDTSATYNGLHLHTYSFEAAAYDRAGNLESILQIAETTTQVDTVANDFTAPGPPLLLTAGGTNPSPWQNNPTFQVAWVPPSDASGIERSLFKVDSPPAANFDTTGSAAGESPLNFVATQEDGQNFYLWFQDGRGNVDFRNYGSTLLRYDGTVPQISELAFQNPDFDPYWFNQDSTVEATINIKYNESHLQLISLESEKLNISKILENVPSGEDISFNIGLNIKGKPDGVFELEISLIDSAKNNRQARINLGLDSTPPTGTEASSPDTSTSETFTVTWTGTGTDNDGSGLSEVYDVRYQVDNGAWLDLQRVFQETSITFRGEHGRTYGFEVIAHDNVGNVESFSGTAESVTAVDTGFVDSEPPTISHQPPLTVDEGQDVIIQAAIQDNSQIAQAVLFYRQSGKDIFQPMQMSNVGGDTYTATIPAAELSIYGINYYIQAWDGIHFSYFPQSNWDTLPLNLSVRITGINNEGLLKETSQPGGAESTFYRMISVPLNLDDKSALNIFEDDLGQYESSTWRLFQYNSGSDTYSEYPDIRPFSPGTAGWLIVRDPNKRIDSGTGTSVEANRPFEIPLSQGWNDFGLPFSFPVDWSDILATSTSTDAFMGLYTYQGQWLLPGEVTTLSPWEGYSVFSQTSGVALSIPPLQSDGTASVQKASLKFTDSEWFLRVEAVCESALDGSSYLGVAQNAAETWDKLDYLEPPYIADFVSVRFPHNDWQGFHGNFTTDFRPPFYEGQVWHFQVKTNIQNASVKLRFRNLASLPFNFQASLLDNSTLQKIDIREIFEYEFLPDQNSLQREFDLIIGTNEYVENSDQLAELSPESFYLSQNFPNPFNAGTSLFYQVKEQSEVSIKVLNILGQEVRKLLSENHIPGTYRINWDGTADNGHAMGSGIYIIQFEAGKFQQIRKVLLIR
ncbi:VCBS repeat-containing protein [candidate division KSB1 bacterium]|nr:VCBS repeat-containing protein [candidate division KSB1 bacterium]